MMKTKTRTIEKSNGGMPAALMVVGLLLTTPHVAHAYVDPGSGAFVYQTLYAACLGGLFYFRRFLDGMRRRRKAK